MADNIGFIGIGAMGFGMAGQLRRQMQPEATLLINDRNRKACEDFISQFREYGPIVEVPSAKAAVEKANIVISMVPGPEDVKEVYLNPDVGAIAALTLTSGHGKMILECSTIDPKTTREVRQALSEAGFGLYVDAPVSGGIARAADGNLAFMIGHPNDSSKATDRIRSVVSMMGNPDKIFFCGDIGSGLAAKISNNYLAGSFNVAISQAMSLGIRSGVDKQMLFDVIRNSSGQSWMLENHQPVPGLVATAPSSRGYEPSFRHRLMMKDIGLGIQAAREVGIEPTIAETALQMYERAANDEEVKDLDYTSVYRMINEAANKR